MNYKIEYGCGVVKQKNHTVLKLKLKPLLISAIILCAAALFIWPNGRILVRDLLLPGDEAVTAAALTGLVHDLKDGQSIEAAVEVFCREIIAGA